jgi:hypothetical protein
VSFSATGFAAALLLFVLSLAVDLHKWELLYLLLVPPSIGYMVLENTNALVTIGVAAAVCLQNAVLYAGLGWLAERCTRPSL